MFRFSAPLCFSLLCIAYISVHLSHSQERITCSGVTRYLRCTNKQQFVCGTDLRTYLNMCHLRNAACTHSREVINRKPTVDLLRERPCNQVAPLLFMSATYIQEDKPVQLFCKDFSGAAHAMYDFYHNNEFFAASSIGQLDIVTKDIHRGNWSCSAANERGNSALRSNNIELSVDNNVVNNLAAISISNHTPLVGDYVTINCRVWSDSSHTITGYGYFKNGFLYKVRGPSFYLQASLADGGMWSCSGFLNNITNSFTTMSSSTVPLTIKFPNTPLPRITAFLTTPIKERHTNGILITCSTTVGAPHFMFHLGKKRLISYSANLYLEPPMSELPGGDWICYPHSDGRFPSNKLIVEETTSCSPVKIYDGVKAVIHGFSPGDTVDLWCLPGYRKVGGDRLYICADDGSWNGKALHCEKIPCDDIIAPSGAMIKREKNKYTHGVVHFACKNGFSYSSGDEKHVCGPDGKWRGKPYICKAGTCSLPPTERGSFLTNGKASYSVGDNASFACDVGYTYSRGDFTIHCTSFGVWQGQTLICDQALCQVPPALQYSEYVNVGQRDVNGRIVVHAGNTVTAKCIDGYGAIAGDFSRHCTSNWELSGKPLQCAEASIDAPVLLADNYVVSGDLSIVLTCLLPRNDRDDFDYSFYHGDKNGRGQGNTLKTSATDEAMGDWFCQARHKKNKMISPESNTATIRKTKDKMNTYSPVSISTSLTAGYRGESVYMKCVTNYPMSGYIFMRNGEIVKDQKNNDFVSTMNHEAQGMWACTGYNTTANKFSLKPSPALYIALLDSNNADTKNSSISLTFVSLRDHQVTEGVSLQVSCSVIGKQIPGVEFVVYKSFGKNVRISDHRTAPTRDIPIDTSLEGHWVCMHYGGSDASNKAANVVPLRVLPARNEGLINK